MENYYIIAFTAIKFSNSPALQTVKRALTHARTHLSHEERCAAKTASNIENFFSWQQFQLPHHLLGPHTHKVHNYLSIYITQH